jgi:ureidoglycolate lyase
MKEVNFKKLTFDNFNKYGSFAHLIDPKKDYYPNFGNDPIEFYRDMILLDLGISRITSFSICRVMKREPIIDFAEFHSSCGEGILPLDNDIFIHVGPATSKNEIPLNEIETFLVEKHTFVSLRPGVWHGAPFLCKGNTDRANVLIVLPERTYANDCTLIEIPEKDQLKIIEE